MNKKTGYNNIGSFLYKKYLLFLFMNGKNYQKEHIKIYNIIKIFNC